MDRVRVIFAGMLLVAAAGCQDQSYTPISEEVLDDTGITVQTDFALVFPSSIDPGASSAPLVRAFCKDGERIEDIQIAVTARYIELDHAVPATQEDTQVMGVKVRASNLSETFGESYDLTLAFDEAERTWRASAELPTISCVGDFDIVQLSIASEGPAVVVGQASVNGVKRDGN